MKNTDRIWRYLNKLPVVLQVSAVTTLSGVSWAIKYLVLLCPPLKAAKLNRILELDCDLMRRSHRKLHQRGNKTNHETAPVSTEDHVDDRRCNTEVAHSVSLSNYLLKDDKIRDAETPVGGEDWRDGHHRRPKRFGGNGIFLHSPNGVRMQTTLVYIKQHNCLLVC